VAGHPCPLADAAALQFLKQFEGAMFHCINAHCIPQHERPDVAQDVRIIVLRSWRKHGAIEGKIPAGYIYTITRNVCLKHIARRKRTPLASDGATVRLVGTAERQDEWLERNDACERLRMAILTLPPVSRLVMQALVKGRTLLDVATELELKYSTAKTMARRARTLLRKRLVR
jgi:RNA polymerase sigma factor (sigma-70 family)